MHHKIKEGTLEFSQPEVQRNPLLNHKGKGLAIVVICVDLGEDKEEGPTLLTAAITILYKSSKSRICSTNWGSQGRDRMSNS